MFDAAGIMRTIVVDINANVAEVEIPERQQKEECQTYCEQ
jgi:hypothetical protein